MAYAAVISLKHTILRVKNPTIDPEITKSAYEKLESIEDVLKRLDGRINSSINRRVIYELDAEIREAVSTLQDAVESYDLPLPPADSLADNGVNQEIDLFLKVVEQLEEKYTRELYKYNPSPVEEDGAVSHTDEDFGGNKSTMIGLSDQFEEIRNLLLQHEHRGIGVCLVGMAGIGKSHLARQIYQHPLIVRRFDYKVWLRIGPTYQPKNILVDLVAQIEGKPRNLYMGENMDTLVEFLAKCLYQGRHLIVLDDIWSFEILRNIIDWLPANRVDGRLLVTTRTHKATRFHNGYKFYVHKIRFLNGEESWNLLWQNVFAGKQSFPPQLEKVGRKIAELCEGLPLYILAVADELRGRDKTEEYWKEVADKKTPTFFDAYAKISKLLYSSYEYLPQHLKACFLYMGVFPQSFEISLPKLINLWIVEDFLESRWLDPLEDMAMRYMKELDSNSVVIICKQRTDYRIESSKLHCVYWYLCVEEARRSKLFHVLKSLTDASRDSIESQSRFSVQNNILFGIKEVYESMAAATLTARSLLFTGEDHQYPVRVCLNLMLLKVLDALAIRFYEFPTEVLNLLQLRYLALTHNGKLPSSISKLQQLHCLILRRHHNIKLLGDSTNYLPKEIWDMQELRYLRIM